MVVSFLWALGWGLSYLLTVRWRLPSSGSHSRQLPSWPLASSESARDRILQQHDITIICDITTWIPSCLPYSTGQKQITSPAPTQGDLSWEAGLLRAILERASHIWGWQEYGSSSPFLSSVCILLLNQEHIFYPFLSSSLLLTFGEFTTLGDFSFWL